MKDYREFKQAVVVGRFGVMHLMHEKLVNIALANADQVLIMVGSAQEKGTIRNPFSVDKRIECIRKIFRDEERVTIVPLNDLTNENDNNYEWGDYFMNEIMKYTQGIKPDLFVFGSDKEKATWFRPGLLNGVTCLEYSRNESSVFNISATKARCLLALDRYYEWAAYHSKRYERSFYAELKADLVKVNEYDYINKHASEMTLEDAVNYVNEANKKKGAVNYYSSCPKSAKPEEKEKLVDDQYNVDKSKEQIEKIYKEIKRLSEKKNYSESELEFLNGLGKILELFGL